MFLLLKGRLRVKQIRLGHVASGWLMVSLESTVRMDCTGTLLRWWLLSKLGVGSLLIQICGGGSRRQLLGPWSCDLCWHIAPIDLLGFGQKL